jgi:hypothetical protein
MNREVHVRIRGGRGVKLPPATRPVEIISHCVWLYHRFPLSFREVEERNWNVASWSPMKRCGKGAASSGRST